MLPDSDAVRAAALGDGGRPGFVEGLVRGSLVIDMSSSAPLATRGLGEALGARGIGLVDAPVSGGVPRARDGTLTIMAGGEARLVDEAEPLLTAMGRVHRTGPLGSGHAMKALNNYVSAAGLFAVCEALIVARTFGLDPRVMNQILKVSTGRNNTTDNKVEAYMLSRSFDSGFALDLMRKDVGTAEALAEELGLDAPWLRACSALLGRAAGALDEGADHTAAFAFLERELTGRSAP
jgi:3-hydroxyisobutyrate dehydrogenase